MKYITEISESDAQTSYPVSDVLYAGKSTWCDTIVIARSPTYGKMLFLDGELQSAEADEHIYHESLVHVAMSAGGDPKRVLVIGGGEGATVREVLRWSPTQVDWVDIDPVLVSVCEEHLAWAAPGHWPNVAYFPVDIREYWTRCDTLYDVILIDLPDPDGETGYLYSATFWDDVRSHLLLGGRFVTHVGPVRPFGEIGGGVQRILETTREAGLQLSPAGFYHIGIPSFQGEWGFWCWVHSLTPINPFLDLKELPDGLRVVDAAQLQAWATPTGMWRRELARLISP